MADNEAVPTTIATHGIELCILAIKDKKGQVITGPNGLSETGIYFIDGNERGTTQANITGIEQKGQAQWANDSKKRVNYGSPEIEVALTLLDADEEPMNKCLGTYTDSTTGITVRSGSTKPNVAMILVSKKYDGNKKYECFANGNMILPGSNHQTDNTNQTAANPAFTYSALAPLDKDVFLDDKGNQQLMGTTTNADPKFDLKKLFDVVFPGNKYGTTTASNS
ncbi:phage tail protein [Fructilactobacillus myrtifloralis]|uniref:Phage tail protein n=1 Tax=Fructilactobacillus myrtifloralis TaxID=2940301 RepID=A0ABY5BNC7_9LACO|nr:phage tail protein [Fructilactobacillus myrtifloralis]USS85082.1 phage tail protein [Fructilactobacillus myrtifloralis]